MNKQILLQRMKNFALRIIRMIDKMPVSNSSRVIGSQVLRSATSIGANYVACYRAKSTRDFINKLKIIEEETAETIFWLELLDESGIFETNKITSLKTEANEILSIIVASIKTAKKKSMTNASQETKQS